MEPKPFLRRVLALQAHIRGFLVRRQLQNLRAEYEATVQEIEGDLGSLQWTEGWIPRPRFLPQKAKSHYSWKSAGKIPKLEQELRSHSPCNEFEKAPVREKVLKQSEESPANTGRLPGRDDSPWLHAEQGRKTRGAGREEARITPTSKVENSEAAGPGLSQSQQELPELQGHRNHLAMELLWLQQAINSRKEYLILKQALRFPEAGKARDKPGVCLDPRGQAREEAWSPPSCLLKDQSCRDRTTAEPDHAAGSCQRGRSQPCEPGAQGRAAGCKSGRPQLPTALDSQAGGDGFTTGQDQPGQGICLQQKKLLRTQTLGDRMPGRSRSKTGRTQLSALCKDPDMEDRPPPKSWHLQADCTLAGLEPDNLDLRGTKAPTKGQIRSDRYFSRGIPHELGGEGWGEERTEPWR